MFSWLFDDDLSLAGKVSWGTLLALVFLVPLTLSVPLAGAPFTADLFDTPKVWLLRVGAMIILAAWTSDLCFKGGKIRYSKVAIALFGILSVVFIASTVTSIEPMQSFLGKYRRYDGLWSFLIYGILLWTTMQYAVSSMRIKQLMQALSASSILVAGYGLLQAFGIMVFQLDVSTFEANRSFSTYGNPDLLAGFLAFGIFINLGLAIGERRGVPKTYYWVASLINVAVAITAFTRSIWVASVVGLIVLIVFVIRQRPRLEEEDYGFIGATLVAAGAFVVRSLRSSDSVMNFASRVASIFDFKAGSAVTRFEIWDAAWQATTQKPFLGWGPDTFRMVFRRFQPSAYSQDAGYRSVADNVHNYPLQMAAGIGLGGAVLLYALQLWIIGLAIRYGWKRPVIADLGKSKRDQQRAQQRYQQACTTRMYYIGVLTAVVTYVIHLCFGLSLPGCTFLLWIFLGILLAPAASVREIRPLPRTVALVVVLIAGVAYCISTVYATQLLWADHAYMQAQTSYVAGDIAQALVFSQQSVHLSPSNDQYAIEYTQLAVEAAAGKQMSVNAAANTTYEMVEKFSNEYDVYLIALWSYKVLSQADNQYLARAVALGKSAIKTYPNGLALRYSYAETLEIDGQIDEAIAQLEYCTKYDTSFVEARTKLEELQAR